MRCREKHNKVKSHGTLYTMTWHFTHLVAVAIEPEIPTRGTWMEAYTERSPPATLCLTMCLCKVHSGCHTFSSFDFLHNLMEQMLLITSLFHRLKKSYRGWLNNSFQALTSNIGLCKIKIQTTGWYSPCQNGYNVTQDDIGHSDWSQVQGIPNRKDRILPTKPEYLYPRRKSEVTMYCLDQTVPTKTPCSLQSWRYGSSTLHLKKKWVSEVQPLLLSESLAQRIPILLWGSWAGTAGL